MKLTLKRAKSLLEAEWQRQSALILCDTQEEAEDILRAACCWLTHIDLQATPGSIEELEKAYTEAQSRFAENQRKNVIFPVNDNDDNC